MNATQDTPRRRLRSALSLAFAASALCAAPLARADEPPPLPPPAPPLVAPQNSPQPAPADTSGPEPVPVAEEAGSDLLMPPSADAAAPAESAPAAEAPVAKPAHRRRAYKPYVYQIDPGLVAMDDRIHHVETATAFMHVGGHMFFWPYLVSGIVGYATADCKASCGEGRHLAWLMLPSLGPFIAAGLMNGVSDAARGVLVADGALQTAGLITFIVAAATAHREATKPITASRGPTVRIGPGPGAGVGVVGTF